jgi:hypothetical protein
VPDAITAGFLILAFVPWLAPLIKTVEVPGVGKVELREIERKTEEAKGAAASADQKAGVALAATAGNLTQTGDQPAVQSRAELSALAAEYNLIRSTQHSGPARTSAMTAVVSKLIRPSAGLSSDDIRRALKEADSGQRLIAYAALYARPKPDLLEDLVASVTVIEDKPFGQYWGILAISSVIGMKQNQVPVVLVKALQDFLDHKLAPGTDRYYELSRLLASLKS